MLTEAKKFRPDIQGLRALAIIPIVLFHAGLTALPGGFLGVDIFFVISGYLITRIIVGEMEAGTFSFLGFYKRRAIRILPAFLVMVAIIMAIGVRLLIPAELGWNGKSGAAAALFAANIYFWRVVDYFGPESDSYLFLHTWSLGVEEQFYIFFPIFILVARRFLSNWLQIAVAVVIAVSFAISLLLYARHPQTAFYLLPSRVWQLGLGAAIALGLFPMLRSKSWRLTAARTGLAMICVSIFFVEDSWQVPAPWGLLPSFGTALLIAYGERGLTATLLSMRTLRWFGAISYSLYLWHWPIIALYRIQFGMKLALADTVVLLLASVVAGAGSYYLIERPVMNRLRNAPAKPVLLASATSVCVAVMALLFVANMPETWSLRSPEALRIASYLDYDSELQFRPGLCFATDERPTYDPEFCTRTDPDKRTFALIGDSHAAQYYRPWSRRFSEVNLIQATASGCRVLVGATGPTRCNEMVAFAFGELLDEHQIDRVILGGRWEDADFPLVMDTIALLQQRRIPITVIGPVAQFDRAFPRLLSTAVEFGSFASLERERQPEMAVLEQRWAPAIRARGADYYSVLAVECPDTRCLYTTAKGEPIHFDYGHTTEGGGELLLSGFPAY